MKLHFCEDGRRPDKQPRPPVRPAEIPMISDTVLERHGARILRPADAVRLADQPPLAPTVYRYGTLLVPEDVLRTGFVAAINENVLGRLGLALVPPPPLSELVGRDAANSPTLARLPRAVGVRVVKGATATVDSWRALQALRAAGADGRADSGAVARIGLEHLLTGSALTGVGTSATLSGTNFPTEGFPDRGGLSSAPRPGFGGRIPVEVVIPRPEPRPLDELGIARRPLVAVLDTGISDHPWLDFVDRAKSAPGDEFVIVDSGLQELIRQIGITSAQTSATPTEPLVGYYDQAPVLEPLKGELASHFGHGTFIAGIIRQLAPDARVLAIRVMHTDGFAYEGELLFALAWLTAHAQAALAGDPKALPVDVVSLSLGFFPETPYEVSIASKLADAVDALTATGAIVVAAAGNYSSSREFQPAALAARPVASGHAPVISVGALNPNGTVAYFSDQAPWVKCYAPGVSMVSAYPRVRGSVNPEETVPGPDLRRETFDPDDFSSGFAVWSGTSFAAPAVAAELAGALVGNATADPDHLGMTGAGQEAALGRARQAYTGVKKKWLQDS
jgi:subtilisin family serine protease